jgi:hypothetical protein
MKIKTKLIISFCIIIFVPSKLSLHNNSNRTTVDMLCPVMDGAYFIE